MYCLFLTSNVSETLYCCDIRKFVTRLPFFCSWKQTSQNQATPNSQHITHQSKRLVVWWGSVHSGCCRFSIFWAKRNTGLFLCFFWSCSMNFKNICIFLLHRFMTRPSFQRWNSSIAITNKCLTLSLKMFYHFIIEFARAPQTTSLGM